MMGMLSWVAQLPKRKREVRREVTHDIDWMQFDDKPLRQGLVSHRLTTYQQSYGLTKLKANLFWVSRIKRIN